MDFMNGPASGQESFSMNGFYYRKANERFEVVSPDGKCSCADRAKWTTRFLVIVASVR
jgi:hypothetical protein